MKILTLTFTVTMLGTAALLAACGDKRGTEPVKEAEAAAPASTPTPPAEGQGDAMAGMDMAGAKMAKTSGTVTAIDKGAGTITVDHQPIPEAGWPAMSMAFKASPEAINVAKVGEKVNIDLMIKDGAGEITALTKQ